MIQPATSTDETDPKAVVGLLHRRIEELSEAVAARDTFIAVAAHELRNPMTPMMGQLDLVVAALQAGRLDAQQLEQRLERIRRTMGHYIKRTATLLDVSRITSGKLRLQSAPCDLVVLLHEVAQTFAETARHEGSAITIEAPAALPGVWDHLAVEQIIDNLISNAIKYGGRRPVEVRLDHDDGAGTVRLRVSDHGPGISPADRARIFGRFERVVGPSERHSGFGIGLWVVGQLVEAMSGSIGVDDTPGGGSLFTVVLPCSPLSCAPPFRAPPVAALGSAP